MTLTTFYLQTRFDAPNDQTHFENNVTKEEIAHYILFINFQEARMDDWVNTNVLHL